MSKAIEIEICTCPEAIGLETDGTTLTDSEAAAGFVGDATRALEAAGYAVEEAKGQRTLADGWWGAQVFCPQPPPARRARKSALWLTFDKISDAEERKIDAIVCAARDACAAELAKPLDQGGYMIPAETAEDDE